MARRAVHAALLVGLLASLLSAQDFDLSDALDDFKDEKPTAKPRKPTADHDLNLEDALGGGGNDNPAPQPYPPRPKPDRNPNQPGTSGGGFSDKELADAVPEGGGGGGGDGGGSQRKEDEDGSPPGVVPGIVGAVVVAVAGAISSFIAYQKKKFCFKENDQSKM